VFIVVVVLLILRFAWDLLAAQAVGSL
jgi:hypothetical protein